MEAELIFEEDLEESQFPWDEIDEMDAIDEGMPCPGCHVIPHPNPWECTR